MNIFTSCKEAINKCIDEKRFAVAYLNSAEMTLDMHIHDCFEIYIALSGGKQFFINDKCYDVNEGDIFVINQYESHYLVQDGIEESNRYVISVYPDFLEALSSDATNLTECFYKRDDTVNHKISTDEYNLNYILKLIQKLVTVEGYGVDLVEKSVFCELLVMINALFLENHSDVGVCMKFTNNELVGNMLEYINDNIVNHISIESIAKEFYISSSYACRLFKNETGTTINKYVTARKISLAKSLLANGATVKEACERSGFNDYANFIKAFKKAVGVSPKRYGKCNMI